MELIGLEWRLRKQMTDFTKHKLSDTEREKITVICTSELLRLYKTDTNLNSRINRYLDTDTDDNGHDAVKDNISNCYAVWNINRLNDDDHEAALLFLLMADKLAEDGTCFEYDTLSAYTDKEQYSSPFTSFTHVIILASWADWDELCKEILIHHFSEVVELLKESSKRQNVRSKLLDSLLPKGD